MKLKITFTVLLMLGFVYLGISQDETQDLSKNPEYIKINLPVDTNLDSIIIDGVTYPGLDLFVACEKTPEIYVDEISKFLYYSEEIHSKGIEGKVIARVLVSSEGKIVKSYIEYSKNELLNNLTLEAIYRYTKNTKITPAVQRGKPISLWISVPFTFSLNNTKIKSKIQPDSDKFIEFEKEPEINMKLFYSYIVYPEEAKKEGIEGKVIIQLFVKEDGTISKPFINYSDNELLSESAMEAIQDFSKEHKILPAIQNGKPVDSWLSIPLNYKLRIKEEKKQE